MAVSTSFNDPSGVTGGGFGGYVEQVRNPDAFEVDASAGSTSVTLTWVAQPNALFYRVYCGLTETGMRLMMDNLLDLTATVGGLVEGNQYFFQVVAVDGTRKSTASLVFPEITSSAPPPVVLDLHYDLGNCPYAFDAILTDWVAGSTATANFTAGTPGVYQFNFETLVIFPGGAAPSTTMVIIVNVDSGLAPTTLSIYYNEADPYNPFGAVLITTLSPSSTATLTGTADSGGSVTWVVA
jgi:hypothetical protein